MSVPDCPSPERLFDYAVGRLSDDVRRCWPRILMPARAARRRWRRSTTPAIRWWPGSACRFPTTRCWPNPSATLPWPAPKRWPAGPPRQRPAGRAPPRPVSRPRPAWRIPTPGGTRPRRHGHGLQGPAHQAGPRGRPEGAGQGPRRGRAGHRPLRARDEGHRPARPSADRPRPRRPGNRRPPGAGHGVCRGAGPGPAGRACGPACACRTPASWPGRPPWAFSTSTSTAWSIATSSPRT